MKTKTKNPNSQESITYSEILSDIKKYMILQGRDEFIIDLILASSLSIYTERPVWLMIIAPPSSGKTELLDIIRKVNKVHFLSNITAKTLFSGHSSANGGFMIRVVKKLGILLFPDFTTIISQDSRNRNGIYNQLRVIYDGVAGLETGIETGNSKVWVGKIALIANVTEVIERLKDSSNDLGERFLYFNYYPKVDASKIIGLQNYDTNIKKKVQKRVIIFLESLKNNVSQFIITEEDKEYLLRVSEFISIGRSIVDRNSRTREVEHVHQPERPFRLFKALSSLFISLMLVNNNKERTKKIISSVSFSTIPLYRKKIVQIILHFKKEISTNEFNSFLNISSSKIGRTLEDMVLQKMITIVKKKDNKENYYNITEKFGGLLEQF